VLLQALEESGRSFEQGELAYLPVTSKVEFPVRDRFASEHHWQWRTRSCPPASFFCARVFICGIELVKSPKKPIGRAATHPTHLARRVVASGQVLTGLGRRYPLRYVSIPKSHESRCTVPEDQPVLNTLAEITAVSVARGTLDAREHMLARLAALVAIDAPAASYVLNVEPSAEVGLTVEDVQGLLIAIAPIVGTPRVVSAAGKITDALGFVIDVAIAEAEVEAELEAQESL
jgi:alkylhydroperoxidase/carboxymuconolactone decarboxylase family protein YurZ